LTLTFAQVLPHLNASMNATSALLLLMGLYFVKSKQIDRHKHAMFGAVCASTIFLIGYLTRHYLTGTTHFQGEESVKRIYLTILYSHMTLAVICVPLVFRLLYLAAKERNEEHKKLARWTFPAWIYVSITGIVVYVMLYH